MADDSMRAQQLWGRVVCRVFCDGDDVLPVVEAVRVSWIHMLWYAHHGMGIIDISQGVNLHVGLLHVCGYGCGTSVCARVSLSTIYGKPSTQTRPVALRS